MGLSNVDQVIFKEEQPLMRIERTIPREVVHEVLMGGGCHYTPWFQQATP